MYSIIVMDEKRFMRFLKRIEKRVRESIEGLSRLRLDRLKYIVNRHFDLTVMNFGHYEVDGVLFEYNKRWIEILKDGRGDYGTFYDFLEDEFEDIHNWLTERVAPDWVIQRGV